MTETRAATIVLVPYNNAARTIHRLTRDILPSLTHYPDWHFQLVVVDNSEQRQDQIADLLANLQWPARYVWNEGRNLYYGPALNLAASLAEHPFLVYACTNHGRMIDPGWIGDLVRPLWEDERVAMTGHPFGSPYPWTLGFRDTGNYFHIQGGVLATRTDLIRRYPYDDGQYAHLGSDIWQCYRLMQEGFLLRQVPSIVSVWRQVAPHGPWKYIHDHSEGD
jgi:hypothetical protein